MCVSPNILWEGSRLLKSICSVAQVSLGKVGSLLAVDHLCPARPLVLQRTPSQYQHNSTTSSHHLLGEMSDPGNTRERNSIYTNAAEHDADWVLFLCAGCGHRIIKRVRPAAHHNCPRPQKRVLRACILFFSVSDDAVMGPGSPWWHVSALSFDEQEMIPSIC